MKDHLEMIESHVLTAWSRVILEMMIVAETDKNFCVYKILPLGPILS
jgi:hypothetical protein